ncbi:MAG TPA: hypothetical protein VFJ18_01005 [Pararhizobium sp.]|nr:hypothetical protein [Pararhizobium sp.]
MTSVRAITLAACAVALLSGPALAQHQSPEPNKPKTTTTKGGTQGLDKATQQQAEVGAGTFDGTTTGSSGPKTGGPKGPQKPDASMCKKVKGDAHDDCLATVLNRAPKSNGG